MEYCQLYNGLGELGFYGLNLEQSSVGGTKRILYLFFLLLQPMNVPYAWTLFVFAVLSSIFQRSKQKSSGQLLNFLSSLTEEEVMNLFLMVFLIPSGKLVKLVVQACLYIWAAMHVCVLADEQLQSNPGTVGLSALKPAIDWVNLSRVEVNLFKNKIEIGLALCTLPLVFAG